MNVDLSTVRQWLNQCGSCDGGLPMNCSCPDTDPRQVIADLYSEVVHLRQKLEKK